MVEKKNHAATVDSGSEQSPIKLSADVQIAIRNEVETQLNKQVSLIKDWAQLGLKIIGVAFLVLTTMLTVFGLTNWKDIRKDTAEEVKREAASLIGRADSETGVKQTLNDLVNRSVVGSTLISLKQPSSSRPDLATADWERLTTWIRQENLSIDDFTGTLEVLESQTPDRKSHDANSFLAEMLSAEGRSKFAWMRKQPEKRLAILHVFHNLDIGNTARNIAVSDEPVEMRIAAVVYLRDVGYAEGFTSAIKLVKETEPGRLRSEAFITAAALNPTHPSFLAEIQKLIHAAPVTDEPLLAVSLLGAMWPEQQSNSAAADDVERFKVGSELLSFFTSQGGIILVTPDLDLLTARTWGTSRVRWQIHRGNRTSSVGMSINEFKALRVYWVSLKVYAQEQNFDKLKVLLPTLVAPVCCSIELTNPDPQTPWSVKDVRSGQINSVLVGREIRARAISADTNGLLIEWRDSKAGPDWQRGYVSDLKAKDLLFSLKSNEGSSPAGQ